MRCASKAAREQVSHSLDYRTLRAQGAVRRVSSGAWLSTPNGMRSPRDAHSALPFGAGVLLIGGRTSAAGITTTSVEIYNLAARRTYVAPAMKESRAFALVIRTGAGILAAGGFHRVRHDHTIAECELLTGGAWLNLPALRVPRELAAAAQLATGEILVAGGFSKGRIVASAEMLSSEGARLEAPPAMRQPRFGHCMALVGGRALAMGGRAQGDVSLRSTEWYTLSALRKRPDAGSCVPAKAGDGDEGSWTAGPPLALDRFRATLTPLPDGRWLIAGGYSSSRRETLDSAEILEPGAPAFRLLPGRMADGRMDHAATLLPDGRVLITGGWCSQRQSTVASADLFDPETESFTPAPPLPSSRHEHTSTLLACGEALVAGGQQVELGRSRTLADVALFVT